MKIGIISDSHGNWSAVQQAVMAAGAVDLWLHAGDCSQDAALLPEQVTAVAGNCDGQVAAKRDEFIEAAGKKIWLTHGHYYHVKQGLQELIWWAQHYQVDAVVFGHTHIPLVESAGQLLIVNPGSVGLPHGLYATYAIMEIIDGDITAHIEVIGREKKPGKEAK